jgi:hypothetical protein
MTPRGFGSLGFWHLVPGAPKGCSRVEKARELLAMWREKRLNDLMPDNPKMAGKAADIFRAMVLELAVGDHDGIPEIAELVEAALPKWAYAVVDPVHVYSGDGAGPGQRRQIAWRRLENLCRGYDIEAVMTTGKQMAVSELVLKLAIDVEEDDQLRRGVAHLRGLAPATDKTVREWRRKASYRGDIEAARNNWLWRQARRQDT